MKQVALSTILLAFTGLYGISVRAIEPSKKISAEAAFPRELVHFRPYSGNPVFIKGGPGHWDSRIRERGYILRCGATWHLWYTGYDDSSGPKSNRFLGHAVSTDGIRWSRDARNPLVRNQWVEDMVVVYHDRQFYMFAEGLNDRAHWFTSPDGETWTRQGKLDVRDTGCRPLPPGPIGTPTVWRFNNAWYLMFERGDRAVWLARSSDLCTWQLVQEEPVLTPGPDKYDQALIAVDQVIRYGGKFYAIYHGTDRHVPPQVWTTSIAVSEDAVHWTKYAGNPIVPSNRSSGVLIAERPQTATSSLNDATSICDGFEFPTPTRFRLYTMHDRVDLFLPE